MATEIISYLYFLVDTQYSAFKVGVSANPFKRSSSLPEKIDISKSLQFACKKSEVYRIEKIIHFLFDADHSEKLKGDGFTEWFSIGAFERIREFVLNNQDKLKWISCGPINTIQEESKLTGTSRRGFKRYRENPFWEPTEIKVGTKTIRVARGRHTSDEGESVQHSGIHIIEQVDLDEFVKLYTKNIKTFFDLKPSTQKVLQAILHIVQKNPGSDAIYLPFFEVQDYSKKNDLEVSKASFHNAMREMLNKGFLAEAEAPNKYWINPHLFFNGDRMTFIREYRLKNEKTIRNNLKQPGP